MSRIRFILVAGIAVTLSACDSSGGADGMAAQSPVDAIVHDAPVQAVPGAERGRVGTYEIDALVFTGPGTWDSEIPGIRDVLNQHGVSFREVGSDELNNMSVDEIARFGIIIWPGGSGGTETASLSTETKARLRQAVQERGVSWIGFCAGAFVAVAPAPAPGKDPSYGIGIVDGPELEYYYLEYEMANQLDVAMLEHTFADGTKRDILWYGGPVTPGGPGSVVAKYPNGDAAISQVWAGRGLVMLVAGHPAVPASVAGELGVTDSDGVDQDTAWKLIEATLAQRPLPAF